MDMKQIEPTAVKVNEFVSREDGDGVVEDCDERMS